jgi:hypothetical protein
LSEWRVTSYRIESWQLVVSVTFSLFVLLEVHACTERKVHTRTERNHLHLCESFSILFSIYPAVLLRQSRSALSIINSVYRPRRPTAESKKPIESYTSRGHHGSTCPWREDRKRLPAGGARRDRGGGAGPVRAATRRRARGRPPPRRAARARRVEVRLQGVARPDRRPPPATAPPRRVPYQLRRRAHHGALLPRRRNPPPVPGASTTTCPGQSTLATTRAGAGPRSPTIAMASS